jgi:hypothetical protein
MTTFVGETKINAMGLSVRGFRTLSAARAFASRIWDAGRCNSCNTTMTPNGCGLFVVSWRELPR